MNRSKMFKVTLKGMDKFLDDIDVRGKKEAELKKAVRTSALRVQAQTKDNIRALGVIDTGTYRNSILAETSLDGWAAEVGTPLEIGPYLEFGTRPHFPPLEALEDWARKHGFDSAYPIAKKIAEKGTEARPHLFPAFFAEAQEFVTRIARIVERIFI
jgi:hypothetical protein